MLLASDQVNGLAPDEASAKAGRSLSSERKWVSFGRSGHALWGLCQGSGAQPYQVRIDLTDFTSKCSCPSRKFPCKHGLGLLYLFAEKGALFAEETPCDFLAEWLAGREKRAEQTAQRKAEKAGDIPVDPETLAKRQASQAKRLQSREEKVTVGIADLSMLLQDLLREGLAALSGKPFSYWDNQAARLVDAQAPGLARQISELGSASRSGANWQERFANRLAQVHLACQGWGRIAELPETLQSDLRAFIGFSMGQEEVLSGPGICDVWSSLAQQVTSEEGLRLCRTWLWSVTGKPAVIFQYAYANQPLEISLVTGRTLEAEMAFFPSATPSRGLIKKALGEHPFRVPSGLVSIDAMLADYAVLLSMNPWVDRRPYLLGQVIPAFRNGVWQLQDSAESPGVLSLNIKGKQGWRLLAASGGHPVSLFGEWNGVQFAPLSVIDASGTLLPVTEEQRE